jgi:phosphatidylglycerophosphatase A
VTEAPPRPVDVTFMLAHPAHVIALSGGLGLAPKAPGTVGALLGLPIGWALGLMSWPLATGLVILTGLVGIWACGRTAAAAGLHDHQAIVIDETWATAVVVAFAPAGWAWMIGGFVAFRLFDILKPWPIGWLDRHVGGGFGIMADDGAAALMALVVLHMLARSELLPF